MSTLLLFSCFGSSEAFIFDSIGDAIVSGIKSAFWWVVNGIVDLVIKIVTGIVNWVKRTISNLMKDLFSAISTASKIMQERANKTLNNFFADNFNLTNIAKKMMYVGDLPAKYYIRSFNIKDEEATLDELMWNLEIIAYIAIAVNGFWLIVGGYFLFTYPPLKKQLHSVQELETKVKTKLRKELKKRKAKILQEIEEERKFQRKLMLQQQAVDNRRRSN